MHIVMQELISLSSMIAGVCNITDVKVYLFSFKTQRKEGGGRNPAENLRSKG